MRVLVYRVILILFIVMYFKEKIDSKINRNIIIFWIDFFLGKIFVYVYIVFKENSYLVVRNNWWFEVVRIVC